INACGRTQQPLQFSCIEAGQIQIEMSGLQRRQFRTEPLHIPLGPGDRAIDDQPECADLGLGPTVTENDGNGFELQFLGGLQPQMSIDDIAVTGRENRNLESEFLNGCAHAIDGMVILSRVLTVGNQLIDRPVHQLEIGREGWLHYRPSSTIFDQPSRIFWVVSSLTCSATTAPIRFKIRWTWSRVQTVDILYIRSAVRPILSMRVATTSTSGSWFGRDASAARKVTIAWRISDASLLSMSVLKAGRVVRSQDWRASANDWSFSIRCSNRAFRIASSPFSCSRSLRLAISAMR